MLALARKVNQSIMIGDDIEITLLEIKGDQVKDRNQRTKIHSGLPKRNLSADSGRK